MSNVIEKRDGTKLDTPVAADRSPGGSGRRARRSIKLILPLFAFLIVAAGGFYWRYASGHESTDDAQIDGHLHPVSARVGGTVTKVLVQDNQYVEAGSPLVEIDPKDYQVALDRARADVAEAAAGLHLSSTEVPIASATTSSRLNGAQAGVREAGAAVTASERAVDAARARLDSARAQVREAEANYDKAARDLARLKSLVEKDEISRQQYDAASAAAETCRAQVDSARSRVHEAEQDIRAAESELSGQQARLAQADANVEAARTAPEQMAVTRAREESAAARLQQANAVLEQARLNLSYTIVYAPARGVVSQRSVEVGQVVQTGQPLLTVVPLDPGEIWVTANFKETQLENIRPGQPVTITVDAYGGRDYRGRVDSIAAVTGARSSLLPPENATGNYVKVVQRVPVKIVFDTGQDPEHRLRPGMSVVPTIHTR